MARQIFGKEIPILTDEEFSDKNSPVWEKRKAGDPIAILQTMYHVASHMKDESGRIVLAVEFMALKDSKQELKGWLVNGALEEILQAADESVAREGRSQEEEKRRKFDADPHYVDGKEPNAVLVCANGGAKLVRLDGFVERDDLGVPLDAERIDMVLNKIPEWAEDTFGFPLCGYVDGDGMPKGLAENARIQSISGYDYIAGDCVLVGVDDKYNYLPLHPYDAVTVWKRFK